MKETQTRWPVVITAAGNGTRFRPFTRTLPKEILPIGGYPAIDWCVREAIQAGATDIYIVVRPQDNIIRSYVERMNINGVYVEFVEEDPLLPYGNATPLLCCESHLLDVEHFGVLFGDDVILGGDDFTKMRDSMNQETEGVIAATRVAKEEASAFGLILLKQGSQNVLQGIKQRPAREEVRDPYPLVVVSRLILRSSIFPLLHQTWKREVDLGLAVAQLSLEKEVLVHMLSGDWVTVGDPEKYLHAQEMWKALCALGTMQESRG